MNSGFFPLSLDYREIEGGICLNILLLTTGRLSMYRIETVSISRVLAQFLKKCSLVYSGLDWSFICKISPKGRTILFQMLANTAALILELLTLKDGVNEFDFLRFCNLVLQVYHFSDLPAINSQYITLPKSWTSIFSEIRYCLLNTIGTFLFGL